MTMNREIWIDYLKGVGILLVMWGHSQDPSPIKTFVSLFSVQIFLLVTGYLYSLKNKQKTTLQKAIRRYIKPYVCFSLIAFCVDVIATYINNESLLRIFVLDAYKTLSVYGIHAIWYLPSYSISSYLVLQLQSQKQRLIICVIGIFVLVIVSDLIYNIQNFILFNLVYYPVVAIFRSFACCIIMIEGYLLFELLQKK